jgi:hypothetical protein
MFWYLLTTNNLKTSRHPRTPLRRYRQMYLFAAVVLGLLGARVHLCAFRSTRLQNHSSSRLLAVALCAVLLRGAASFESTGVTANVRVRAKTQCAIKIMCRIVTLVCVGDASLTIIDAHSTPTRSGCVRPAAAFTSSWQDELNHSCLFVRRHRRRSRRVMTRIATRRRKRQRKKRSSCKRE